MRRLAPILDLIGHYKYVITIVVGIVVVGFLDDNSFIRRVQLELQVNDLQAEIARYKEQHEANMRQLNELKHNPDAFEKIARERYFMKTYNEDIYVLSDDKKTEQAKDETTD